MNIKQTNRMKYQLKSKDLPGKIIRSEISIHLSTIFLLFFTLLSSCSFGGENTTEKPLIVCTTGLLADMVEQLVGDDISVKAIMGPGVDPHIYKVSHGDLTLLRQADMIVYNGLFLEGKMAEVLSKLASQQKVIAAAETLPKTKLRESIEFEGNFDPHVWFDVLLWMEIAENLSKILQGEYPQKASLIQENERVLKTKWQSLHQWVQNEIEKIPQEKRILITAHDAFGYFGDAYQVQVRGLQGLSTLSEFGLRDISDLVKFIIEKGVKSIFVESSVSEKAIRSVVQGCKEMGHIVNIGGSLHSDALGAKNSEADTYEKMVKYNVKTIVNGLVGL